MPHSETPSHLYLSSKNPLTASRFAITSVAQPLKRWSATIGQISNAGLYLKRLAFILNPRTLLYCIIDLLMSLPLRRSHFDHHLTTTVQPSCKTSEKPVVTTANRLFLVLAATVQNQQNSRFNIGLHCLVVVLRLIFLIKLHHKRKAHSPTLPCRMKESAFFYPRSCPRGKA